MRASKGHVQSHIRVALDAGVTPTEILEAIEMSLPDAGIVAFQVGFDAWREVVGADGIEPSKSPAHLPLPAVVDDISEDHAVLWAVEESAGGRRLYLAADEARIMPNTQAGERPDHATTTKGGEPRH